MRIAFLVPMLVALFSPAILADDALKPAESIVKIEVLIAEITPEEGRTGEASDKEIIARVLEMEKQGKLDSVTRARLTTTNGQPAHLQFGGRVPIATSRAVGRGGFGEGATSYTFENFGTMFQFTPRIDEDKINLEYMLEQSKVAARRAATGEKAEVAAAPASTVLLSTKSAVSVTSGQTVVLLSRQAADGEGTSHTYVLLTATVEGEK